MLLLIGANILWVNAHGTYLDYSLDGDYSDFRDTLIAHGHNIVSDTTPVDSIDLSQYDIVIVSIGSNWYEPFTESEAHALAEFVRQGKGLLVMSENPNCPNSNLQAILDTFGFTAGGSADSLNIYVCNFTGESPWSEIFVGIDTLYFRAPGTVNGGDTLATDPSGDVYIVGSCFGQDSAVGGVVLVGESGMWANDYYSFVDNIPFSLNMVDFLAVAGEKCVSSRVAEGAAGPESYLKLGSLMLAPGARAEVYSADGRLMTSFSKPGRHALPKGVSFVRVREGKRAWTLKALNP